MEAEQRQRFLELRSAGHSYNKIAAKLKVSKSSLVRCSRELTNELKNAKALELEGIREEFMVSREHRLRIMGTQLSKLTQEVLKRDLTEVPTWRIFDMQRKIIAQIAKEDGEMGEIEFAQEINSCSKEYMDDALRKTVKWTG